MTSIEIENAFAEGKRLADRVRDQNLLIDAVEDKFDEMDCSSQCG